MCCSYPGTAYCVDTDRLRDYKLLEIPLDLIGLYFAGDDFWNDEVYFFWSRILPYNPYPDFVIDFGVLTYLGIFGILGT